MSLSSKFNHDLCKHLTLRAPTYHWSTEFRVGDQSRESVDLAGRKKDGEKPPVVPVLIEAELKREDPAGNILKVWSRILDGNFRGGVIVVQGFSKVYRSSKYHNRRLKGSVAIQLGNLLSKSTKGKLRYFPIEIPYHPRAGRTEGDGARRNAARQFGDQIVRRLRKISKP